MLVWGQVPNGLGLGKVEGVIGEQSLSVGVIDGEGQGLPAENQLQLSGVYDIGVRIQVRSAFPVFVRLYDGGVAGKIRGKLAAGAYPQPYHLLGQEANLHLVAIFGKCLFARTVCSCGGHGPVPGENGRAQSQCKNPR